MDIESHRTPISTTPPSETTPTSIQNPPKFCFFCLNTTRLVSWSAIQKVELLANFYRFLPQGPKKFPQDMDGEGLHFCNICGFDQLLLNAWVYRFRINSGLGKIGNAVMDKEQHMFVKLYGDDGEENGVTNSVEDTKSLLKIMKLRSLICTGYQTIQSQLATDPVIPLIQFNEIKLEREEQMDIQDPEVQCVMEEVPVEEIRTSVMAEIKNEESMDELIIGEELLRNNEAEEGIYDLGEDLTSSELQELDTEVGRTELGIAISNIKTLCKEAASDNDENKKVLADQTCNKVKTKGRRSTSMIFPIGLPNPPRFMLALPPSEAKEARKIVMELGGSVSSSYGFDQSCHALVTTFLGPGDKILHSMISGKVIVRREYLQLCQHYGKFVPIDKKFAWPFTVEEVIQARKLAEEKEDSEM